MSEATKTRAAKVSKLWFFIVVILGVVALSVPCTSSPIVTILSAGSLILFTWLINGARMP